MSYSFTVKGKTRTEAVEAAGVELDKIAEGQSAHQADVGVAENTIDELLGKLRPLEDGEGLQVQANGSLSWHDEGKFISASLNVTVNITKD